MFKSLFISVLWIFLYTILIHSHANQFIGIAIGSIGFLATRFIIEV